MSAWLCENKLLSLVTDVIKSDDFKKYDTKGEYQKKSEIELIGLLSDINDNNLHYLYSAYPIEEERKILLNREYIKQDVDNVQRYKSVCSFIYQSCDYDENYNNKLFKLLVEYRDANWELRCTPQWDKAEWDIDNPIENIGGN